MSQAPQQYIMALDQGTTSSRAILFNNQGQPVATAQKEYTQHYPQPGWVEHDANEIWSSQVGVAAEALSSANIKPEALAAIGITNQRETTIIWHRQTGQPIGPAIVWQDRRTAAYCDALKAEGHEPTIRQKTGLLIDAYFSASKLRWMLDHHPNARALAEAGELAFGTVDCWLMWKLSEGRIHATDVTNASRTMLFNIHTLAWDEELLALFDIPSALLPEVKSCSEVYGQATVLGAPVPLAGVAGDQQAALFGQLCTQPGMVKNTYGTGCFAVMNTGSSPVNSQHQLLTTLAWQINGEVNYALEGSIFVAGAVVQWLRDGLGLFKESHEIEALARSVEDNGGLYLVPALTGLGAPHWDPYARGLMAGITRGTTAGHMARAALEGIAYQVKEVLDAMAADAGLPIQELRVDGGATANNLLMEFQANLLQAQVTRPTVQETTALGAAYLAGLAVGYWPNVAALQAQWQQNRRFEPTVPAADMAKGWAQWQKAIARAKEWKA